MVNFAATLKSKNFRLFFLGQGFSNIGNLIKQVAMSWLVYRLTDSEILLAVVMFSREAAAFLISPFAGVIADTWNKYHVLLIANALLMLNAFFLGILTIYEHIDVNSMIFIQLIFGFISGVEIPTRQAFINDLVEDKNNLTNAIALNSTLVNTARIVGPAVAGVLIPLVGEGFCFLLYGVLLFLIIQVFFFIHYKPQYQAVKHRKLLKEIQEGVQYSYNSLSIRSLMILFASVTMFGISYELLLPVFADDIFEMGATGLGYLTSAVGAGSIVGAFFLANRKKLLGLERILLTSVFFFGVFLTIFSQIQTFWLALVILFFAGTSRVMVFTSNNTLLQTLSEDSKRGRVLSLYIMVFMGSKTLGNLMMGFIGETLGVQVAVLIGGIICIITSLIAYPLFGPLSKEIDCIQQKRVKAYSDAECMD